MERLRFEPKRTRLHLSGDYDRLLFICLCPPVYSIVIDGIGGSFRSKEFHGSGVDVIFH
jgi:hypothetical protein